jgi:hypothetical protein
MKQQFVITHTFPQNEIPTLLERLVKNIPSVKMLCLQKTASAYIFVKT